MADKCNNNITVESLPIKQSALSDDYLLLYNSNVTSRIKLSDIVLGAENLDFYPELISIVNRLDDLTLTTSTGSANWDETYNTVLTNSATWGSFNNGNATQLLDLVADNADMWTDVATQFTINSGSWMQTTAELASHSDRWNTVANIVETSQSDWDSAYTATRDGIAAIHEALEQIEQQPWYSYMYGGSGSSGGGDGGGSTNLTSVYTTVYGNSSRWEEVDIPELYEQQLKEVYSVVTSSSSDWNEPDIPQLYVDKISTLEQQISIVNQNSIEWDWAHDIVKSDYTKWISTHSSVLATSARWNIAFSKVTSASATWDNASSIVLGNHEDWTDVYEKVTADASKWDGTYQRLQNSGNFWDSAYTAVTTKSDNWDTAYDRIVADADDWSSAYTTVITRSPKWEDTYLKVNDDADDWDATFIRVRDYHENWDDTYDRVIADGPVWDGTYNTVRTNSADWFSPPEIINLVTSNSAMWDGAYNFVYTQSSTNNTDYNRNIFVNVSGDTITGDLEIDGSFTVFSDIILGDPTHVHDVDHTPENTENLSLQNVRDFKDVQSTVYSNSSIWFSPPELTALINSNSGMWDDAYSWVNAESATNNTDYNRTTFVNTSGDTMLGELSAKEDVILDKGLYVLSGAIMFGDGMHEHDHVHEPENIEPLTIQDVRDFKSVESSVYTTSGSWDDVYNTVSANSSVWFSPPELTALINANSANWISTHTSVLETSAEWDSVYTFVNTDSATNNTDYNRNTFVNVSGDTITGSLCITDDLTVEGKTELHGGLNVQGLLSGGEAFFSSITALSSYVNVIDIKVRELSGYEIIDGELIVHDDITAAHNLFVTEGAVIFGDSGVGHGIPHNPLETEALTKQDVRNFKSTHISVFNTSANWNSVYNSVLDTSADWDSVYSWVNSDSATNNTDYNRSTFVNVSGDTMTGTLSVDEYLHVHKDLNVEHGSIWFGHQHFHHDHPHHAVDVEELSRENVVQFKSTHASVLTTSSNWDSTHASVLANSSDWDSVYDSVLTTSANWDSTHASVLATSAEWDEVYAFVNADSATNNTDYNRNTFVNVSGDTMLGDLTVDASIITTTVKTADPTRILSLYGGSNADDGAKIQIFGGNQGDLTKDNRILLNTDDLYIGDVHDAVDGPEPWMFRVNTDNRFVTIGGILPAANVMLTVSGESYFNDTLTVKGDISASGDVYLNKSSLIFSDDERFTSIDSKNAKSTHLSVLATSSEWDAVYSFVNSDSATNNTQYNSTSFVNTSGDEMTGDLTVNGTVSATNAIFTYLTALSTVINVVDIKARELSGYDIIDGDLKIEEELYVGERIESTNDINLINGQILFGDGTWDHDSYHNYHLLEELNREDVQQFKSTYTSVLSDSANWVSTHLSVLPNSANWMSTHVSVLANSSDWDSVYGSVLTTSANWDAVYTFVNIDSATNNTDYNRSVFVNVSGDTVTGELSVVQDLSLYENINIRGGEVIFGNPFLHDKFHAEELESLTRENVREFKSAHTSVLTTSSNWDSVYSSVLATSSNWDNTHASVLATSSNWDSTHVSVLANSSDWDSVYGSVLTTSANWDSTHASVLTTSSNWDSTYTSVRNTSANWDSTHASVLATSAEWDAVYAFVNADSATNNTNYNRTTFVNASGDTMTGDLTVNANIINTGYVQTETIATNNPTSNLNIFGGSGEEDGAYIQLFGSNNTDSTDDGRIRIHGEEILVGDIYDVADGYGPWTLRIDTDNRNIIIGGQSVLDDSVLTVWGDTTISGLLNVRDSVSILNALDVQNDITGNNNIIIPTGHIVFNTETLTEKNVQDFKSTHTSVLDTSANWDSVYAFVNSDSATNNTDYNRTTFVNVTGDTMTGDLTVEGTVSATNAIFTYLTALSTVINVVDIKARELSGYDIIDGDLKIEEELYVGERIESTNDINLINGQILFGDGTWDHDNYHNYHLLEELNREDVQQFKSTYDSVLATSGYWDSVYDSVCATSGVWDSTYNSVLTTSANWDAVYAFVNADSATNNTDYNRTTFVNVTGDTVTGELSVVQDVSLYDDLKIRGGEIIFGNPYFHNTFHSEELESLTRENIREFKSTHDSVLTTSGYWDSVYDSVCATSGVWNSTYASVRETSANWNSVYDSVCATSGVWDSTHASVLATSSEWDSVYDSVCATSGVWDSTYNSVVTTSANWDAVYAFVNADSATNNTDYNRNTFVNVSGDTVTGDLEIIGEITGHTLKTADPTTHLALNGGNDRLDGSAIELYGTNNINSAYDGRMLIFSDDIYIGEIYNDITGYGPWLVRYDVNNQQIVFGGTTANTDKLLTVKGEAFLEDNLTVSGDISAKGDIYLSKSSLIFSDGDNRDDEVWTSIDSINSKDTYTSVTNTSGSWDSVYSYTQSDSATNNTTYNLTHFVNTSGDEMTGDLTVEGTVSATNAIFTYLTALSTVINVVDIKARELSGYDIIDGDLKIEEELYVGERIESTNDINLINGQILFGDGTWDHDNYHNYHLLEELNREDVVQFKSTHTSVLDTSGFWNSVYLSVFTTSSDWDSVYNSVLTTSANWDSVYSFVKSDSATNNTDYNRTTFVNVTGDTITGELSVVQDMSLYDDLKIRGGEIIFGNPYHHDAYHVHELESLTRENVREFKSTYSSVLATSSDWDSVYDSVCATSGLWDSVYDSVLTISANWDSVYDSVCATSGDWNSVYNFVNADSGTNNTDYNRTTFVNVTGDTITGELSVKGHVGFDDDLSIYNGEIVFGNPYYHDEFHAWELETLTKQNVKDFKSTHLTVYNNSGNWDSVYHSVCTTSGNWDNTHLTVYNNSGNWDSVYNSVLDTSAEWDAVYTFVNSDSATNNTNYNRNTFVNVSGDTMDGDLVLRTQLLTQTIKTDDATKSLKLFGGTDRADGARIELFGGNQNNSDYDNRLMLHADDIYVGDVYDVVDNQSPWVFRIDVDNEQITVGSITPIDSSSTLSVHGKTTISGELRNIQDIIAESNITLTNGHIVFDTETLTKKNVQDFKSTHTSVLETSAEWDAVYAFVNSDSATNNTTYNRNTFVNVSGDIMTGDYDITGDVTVNGMVSATDGFFTNLTALSTVINVIDIRARELSGYEIIDGTLDIEEELHVGQRIEAKDDINIISGSVIFGQGQWGTDCYHDPANLEYLTKQNVKDFKSTQISVCATSAEWDSVYASVCATSSTWDSVYNSVLETSAEWDSVYDSVCATSGLWDSVYNSVLDTSAEWDAVYTWVNSDSATNNTTYNRNTFVNVSGDHMTGSLEIDGNAVVHGDLTVDGNVWFNATNDEAGITTLNLGDDNTDIIVFNADVRSDILPDVNMGYNLGAFDQHWNNTYTHNICAFGNGAVQNDFLITDGIIIFGDEIFEHGHVHVPGERETLTKYDVRDFKSTYHSVSTTSGYWDSVYDSVCAASGLWDSTYHSVCTTSGEWDSVYDSVCATSGLWDSTHNSVLETSGEWDSVYDSVCATSGVWDSTYHSVCTTSGEWDSVYDSVCATSGVWDSTYHSVCTTSGEWDAVYAFVNADSATNNTDYNRTTFVNVTGDTITGDLEIDGNTSIHGNLVVDGNVWFNANNIDGTNTINLGDDDTDNIVFNANVDSDIIPSDNMTHDLGSVDQHWMNTYTHNMSVHGDAKVAGTTDLNILNVNGLLSGGDAVFTSITALSSVVDVIDIKVRELSGYDIIDGDLRVDGKTTTDVLMLTQSDDPFSLANNGWVTSNFKGDSDSGIGEQYVYTHAVNVYGTTDYTINGVAFESETTGSGDTWEISTGVGDALNQETTTVTGTVGEMITDRFRYIVDDQKIILKDLTVNKKYLFTLYTQAWSTDPVEKTAELSSTANNETIIVSQDEFVGEESDGQLISYVFVANDKTVEFNLKPTDSSSWHIYAFSNREVWGYESESLVAHDVRNFKSTYNTVLEASGGWESVYNFVNADSATNNTDYNRTTFINTSGDTMTGSLSVQSDLVIDGETILTGTVTANNNMYIQGDLRVDGNVWLLSDVSSNLYLGENENDVVLFQAPVDSNIIPLKSSTTDLGDSEHKWRSLYVDEVVFNNDEILRGVTLDAEAMANAIEVNSVVSTYSGDWNESYTQTQYLTAETKDLGERVESLYHYTVSNFDDSVVSYEPTLQEFINEKWLTSGINVGYTVIIVATNKVYVLVEADGSQIENWIEVRAKPNNLFYRANMNHTDVIDSFEIDNFRSAKYIVEVEGNDEILFTEITMVTNGKRVVLTEYGLNHTTEEPFVEFGATLNTETSAAELRVYQTQESDQRNWTPDDLPLKPLTWLDASDSDKMIVDRNNMFNRWENSGTTDLRMVSKPGAEPEYITSGNELLNGKSVLKFTGGSDFIESDYEDGNSAGKWDSDPVVWFMVFKPTDINNFHDYMLWFKQFTDDDNNIEPIAIVPGDNDEFFGQVWMGDNTKGGGSYPLDQPYSTTDLSNQWNIFEIELDPLNETVSMFLNGKTIQQGAPMSYKFPKDAEHQLRLHANWIGSEFTDGYFAEFIVIPNYQRTKVEGYLAHKWGLSESLPTEHVYKNMAPNMNYTIKGNRTNLF